MEWYIILFVTLIAAVVIDIGLAVLDRIKENNG